MKALSGGGWWTLWYALIYLCSYPILGMGRYFRTFQPGKGPQGGEVVMLGGCMLYATLLSIGVVNAVLWSRTQKGLLGPGLAIGGTILALTLVTLAYNRLAENKSDTMLGMALLWIGLAIFLACNLYALGQVRGLFR